MFYESDGDKKEFNQFCSALDDLKERVQLYKAPDALTLNIMAAICRPLPVKDNYWPVIRSGISVIAALGLGWIIWRSPVAPKLGKKIDFYD